MTITELCFYMTPTYSSPGDSTVTWQATLLFGQLPEKAFKGKDTRRNREVSTNEDIY
jgi:hypothetical protein